MAARQTNANFTANLLGALTRLLVALITVPMYIHQLGYARYGVLSIVWVLLGYFGFLDLGLSRATANALAKLGLELHDSRARILVTSFVVCLGFSLLSGFCLFLLGGWLLQNVIAVPNSMKHEITHSLPWIVGLIPLVLISGIGIGALESKERFLIANSLQATGMSMSQILPIVMAMIVSPTLDVVIPTAVVAQAATVMAILLTVYWYERPLQLTAFDYLKVRELLNYGGWITVSSVITPVIVSIDQLLIGALLGVAAVPQYSVPMNFVLRSQILPSALTRTLFPRMSRSSPAEALVLASRALNLLAYCYGIVCTTAIVLTPSFFRYWIGPEFSAAATPVAEVLFVGVWINGLAFVPYFLVQSQGRPDLTGKIHAAEVLPFVGMLWVLTSTYGISGAAAAWTIRCVLDAVSLFWAARIPWGRLPILSLPLVALLVSIAVARAVGANLLEALPAAMAIGSFSVALAYVYSEDFRRLVLDTKAAVCRVLPVPLDVIRKTADRRK